jgi:hypothetical protein
MEGWLSGAFLLVVGVGLVGYALRAWADGEVRAGANFLSGVFTPARGESPGLFYAFVLLYFCGGLALAMWGLLMAFGAAEPLRLS